MGRTSVCMCRRWEWQVRQVVCAAEERGGYFGENMCKRGLEGGQPVDLQFVVTSPYKI